MHRTCDYDCEEVVLTFGLNGFPITPEQAKIQALEHKILLLQVEIASLWSVVTSVAEATDKLTEWRHECDHACTEA